MPGTDMSLGFSQQRKRVSVLGSTGTIGRITVDLLERNQDRFEPEALISAGTRVSLLAEQACRLGVRVVVVENDASYAELKSILQGTGIEVASGRDAVVEAAGRPVDLVVAAIVGSAGLEATLSAMRAGAAIALANKECLVMAGPFFMKEAARCGVSIIPVDSEHSAILQAISGSDSRHVRRIVLTASGGPFRTWPMERLADIRPEDAVMHPNFSMGAKISVDSATMMNKGLELIEAHYLFGVRAEDMSILVHPEQIIHGMVEFCDRSVLAQLGNPDMSVPISVALAWPERLPLAHVEKLDLCKLGRLSFEHPDRAKFPWLSLAEQALESGIFATCVLNAANEIAVAAFLDKRLPFLDMQRVVETALEHCVEGEVETLEGILALDASVRRYSEALIAK